MSFSENEIEYLGSQHLGRLATLRPDGTLQNSPVGYRYNAAGGTIDIAGFNMERSHKFRNVATTHEVAFVVDDIASVQPWRVRCLEIRGTAEAIEAAADSAYGSPGPIIRIHPRRIIAFGLDQPDTEPHQLVPNSRNVVAG
ncbi:PPOX class F420-dependent oxidoreductase [Paractinoplanes durhamensis]|uniref:PPOX class F420-dependent oxidoreductase n=1 Tax=Paractinoplanes durhamensis TaxID=113563 RepID=A0ABQ3ZDT8_9ACTN|nr:PPOX class F420-dependent oxidoreductase [Actinoplanes durhamensis]GIE08013.1 PPOX class F420-dependent oxidoreductase [Actinoplanes durhamensis]